jgi:hypothetical protein
MMVYMKENHNQAKATRSRKSKMNHERAEDTLTSKYSEAIRCIDGSEQYLRTYPQLLRSTALLTKKMGEDALPAIAHMAYGWMPTILKKFSDSQPDIVGPATGCRSFEKASGLTQSLDDSTINNSWVGMSKVLHFMNPEFFPIWDSRVAKHFGLKYDYQINNRNHFLEYLTFVEENRKSDAVKRVREAFVKEAGYEVTEVRASEFILFSA